MKVALHILLAYVAVALQAGLDAFLSISRAEVQLPWLAAAFTAATVPAVNAPLAALAIGLLYDLTGDGILGVHAFAYGIAALVVVKAKPTKMPDWILAACAGIAVAALLTWIVALPRSVGQSFFGFIGTDRLHIAVCRRDGVAAVEGAGVLRDRRRPLLNEGRPASYTR